MLLKLRVQYVVAVQNHKFLPPSSTRLIFNPFLESRTRRHAFAFRYLIAGHNLQPTRTTDKQRNEGTQKTVLYIQKRLFMQPCFFCKFQVCR